MGTKRRPKVDLSDFKVTVTTVPYQPGDDMTPEERLDAMATIMAEAYLRMLDCEKATPRDRAKGDTDPMANTEAPK